MELVLQQRQDLGLSMTFQLRQAIELLQYSTYELDQYIRQQELENPLIELKEKEDVPHFEERVNRRTTSAGGAEIPEQLIRSTPKDMRDELMEYALFMFPEKKTQQLLRYLIYNVDDNGYLQDLDDESKGSLEFSELEIDKGIQLLQQIGPIGIGARNLKECLLLQIRHAYPENKLAEHFVSEHLQLLADHKWNEIASQMNITLVEVKSLHEFIQTLNPRPCSFVSNYATEYWTPDIIIDFIDGAFTFHLNDLYVPTIQLNAAYSQYIHAKDEISTYINEQYKRYQWLINSIEQRRSTIIKIVKVLLDRQADFFMEGFSSLKPLTLKEVADAIDMHESTVSRATANKVIQTPFGSFDLRMLFTSKLETTDGDSVSQTKVKALLENFIAQENKFKPYSDQKIAEYFNTEKGITISRRTIAKYREELRIPPSSKRKEIHV